MDSLPASDRCPGGIAVLDDPRTGLPAAAFLPDRLIPGDPTHRERLCRELSAAGWSWTTEGESIRLHRDRSAGPGRRSTAGPAPAPLAVPAVGWDLDHVLTCAEQPGGNPFGAGHGRPGLDGYGVPGQGRGPVTLPAVRSPLPAGAPPARPVRVVVPDTGLGEHPWLTDDLVEQQITFADGSVAGPFEHDLTLPYADGRGAVPSHLLGALGSHTGHGTFIAGLLRQVCPSARIVPQPIMGADGVVPESVLIAVLGAVLRKQREQPGWADAVVLSLGYYAHTPEDEEVSARLRTLLLDLGRAGVAVFCAAGNDASSRPSYPAAFAADPAFGDPDVVPLVSVAALTPTGRVADFSNDGPWVTAEALGVNLVSTVPVGLDGSARPVRRLTGPGGRIRATVELDDHRGGFASWSGTSFAAPVLAGRYLAALSRITGSLTVAGRRELLPLGRSTSSQRRPA